MRLKILELFGGIGAPRKALIDLGIDVKSVDYVEILPFAVMAYNAMYDNDYRTQSVLDWNMHVDLLIHGSPCQDFSTAGLNDIRSGRSILYNRTLEIIEKELNPRPKYVVWENVKGLISKKHVHHHQHYVQSMAEMGYKSYTAVLNSLDYGLPQNRERVFTVSVRADTGCEFNFDNLVKQKMTNLYDLLDDNVEGYDLKQPSMIKSMYENKTFIAIDYVRTITTNMVRWNTSVVWKNKEDNVSDANGCPAIKAIPSLSGDRNVHKLLRYPTPRECFRLMGFDDEDYDKLLQSDVPLSMHYRLIGNSIPVNVLVAIFRELLKDGQ